MGMGMGKIIDLLPELIVLLLARRWHGSKERIHVRILAAE